jgi:hypothetical protein
VPPAAEAADLKQLPIADQVGAATPKRGGQGLKRARCPASYNCLQRPRCLAAVSAWIVASGASLEFVKFSSGMPRLRGVTRGKRLVVLVGQKKAVAIAVKNVFGRRRWSKLNEWLDSGT